MNRWTSSGLSGSSHAVTPQPSATGATTPNTATSSAEGPTRMRAAGRTPARPRRAAAARRPRPGSEGWDRPGRGRRRDGRGREARGCRGPCLRAVRRAPPAAPSARPRGRRTSPRSRAGRQRRAWVRHGRLRPQRRPTPARRRGRRRAPPPSAARSFGLVSGPGAVADSARRPRQPTRTLWAYATKRRRGDPSGLGVPSFVNSTSAALPSAVSRSICTTLSELKPISLRRSTVSRAPVEAPRPTSSWLTTIFSPESSVMLQYDPVGIVTT